MENLNYDDEVTKSLDKKLADFYTRWDSMTKEEKQKLFSSINNALNDLSQIDPKNLTENEKKQIAEQTKLLLDYITDLKLALGHRLMADADTIAEHVKKLAEQGNPDGIKAWDALKVDYYKSKTSEINNN